MSTKTTIRLRPDGPLKVDGPCRLLDADGATIDTAPWVKKGNLALCRCGHSGSKPFCDGSHRRVGFTDPGLDTNTDNAGGVS